MHVSSDLVVMKVNPSIIPLRIQNTVPPSSIYYSLDALPTILLYPVDI